jgi:hypothetical protein
MIAMKLHRAPATILRIVSSGTIPSVAIGQQKFVRMEDFLDFARTYMDAAAMKALAIDLSDWSDVISG